MISLTAEYALRAVVHLVAVGDENGAPAVLKVGQIAGAMQIPESYLSKVLQQLTRAGLIKSQRGTGGGFRLGRAAEEITAYDVLQAVDPIRRIETCPLGLDAHAMALCPLHKQLDEAAALLEERFRGVRIIDMLETPQAMQEVRQQMARAQSAESKGQ
jgi:Rrf2 family nitric oxide-sensitive transcriptional repressor